MKQYWYIVILLTTNDQQNSIFLYTFVSNKSIGQLLDISPKYFTFLIHISFDQNFHIQVWFTDQQF